MRFRHRVNMWRSCLLVCSLVAVAAVTRVAAAPWVVATPPRQEPVAEAGGTYYYQMQYNALDYATGDMRRRGAAYLEGLQRSLDGLVKVPPASHCDTSRTLSASTAVSADPTPNYTETETARQRASECEARRRAASTVRGAAALALHTARMLGESRDMLDPRREHELVVRLARLLDLLASTVGFQYKPEKDTSQSTTETLTTAAPAPVPLPPHYNNASSELVQQMISCLEPASRGDSRASYLRCPPASLPARRRRAAVKTLRSVPPEDPAQDISAVSKTQPGRSITNDQAGAAATRAQLERHMQEPSAEQTRRFGANYRGNNMLVSSVARILSDV